MLDCNDCATRAGQKPRFGKSKFEFVCLQGLVEGCRGSLQGLVDRIAEGLRGCQKCSEGSVISSLILHKRYHEACAPKLRIEIGMLGLQCLLDFGADRQVGCHDGVLPLPSPPSPMLSGWNCGRRSEH